MRIAIAGALLFLAGGAEAAVYNVEFTSDSQMLSIDTPLKHGDVFNVTGQWGPGDVHQELSIVLANHPGPYDFNKIVGGGTWTKLPPSMTFFYNSDTAGDYDTSSIQAVYDWPEGTSDIAIGLRGLSNSDGTYSYSYTVTPIPLPIVLMGGALAGLAAVKRYAARRSSP